MNHDGAINMNMYMNMYMNMNIIMDMDMDMDMTGALRTPHPSPRLKKNNKSSVHSKKV